MLRRKSILFISVLLIAALSACNLPTGGATEESTTANDLALTSYPPCSSSKWDASRSLSPVSYTHLDVYKRQDVDLGIVWNGEAFLTQTEDPRFEYVFPEEGSIIFYDGMGISPTAAHTDAAYALSLIHI